MILKENETERLSQDMDYLNTLNSLRVEARSLRDKGLEAIVHFSLDDDETWEQDISDNEKVLFRRAKHLAWNLGEIEEYECDHPDVLYFYKEFTKPQPSQRGQASIFLGRYPVWPVIGVPPIDPVSDPHTGLVNLFDMRDEPAPILFAANYLRTRLGNLPGYLDESTLLCYYRIIRELYNLHGKNWALGAARAGEHSGDPSVFVTTECSRAIGYFARLLENTSLFLSMMNETKAYIHHVKRGLSSDEAGIPALHPSWCASELEWCNASLKTTVESFRDYVAILLPDLKAVAGPEEIITLVEKSVHFFAESSWSSFRMVAKSVSKLRQREEESLKKWRIEHSRELGNAALKQMPEFDLTETAHRVALGALAGARQEFKKLAKDPKQGNKLDEASAVFAQLADWLRTHLDPAKEYFEKNLHRCLVESARNKNPKIVQDLAFSALSVGLITKDWNRYDCSKALEILCENLDEDGKFPDGPAFCYTAQHGGRVVINAQIIRAFAQLAQHLKAHLKPEVVKGLPKVVGRMISYFSSQARNNKHGIGWPSLHPSDGKRSCLWVSSLSVLSLHRIVLMLDAYINRGVKKHFKTKSPDELRAEGVPFLHELMCSDIGFVCVRGSKTRGLNRVVMELEGMRAHLNGAGRASKAINDALDKLPLCSLILHGPPGTGKTTLVKSLAVTSNVDLIEVTANDLLRPVTDRVMEQSSDVMDALKLLTSTVILFDEFEVALHKRPETPVSVTEMLTGNMLPKLDALYKAAKKNSIAYVLSTNYVERLEEAAIRDERFDRMKFVYYPDAVSRACRLVSEFRYLMDKLKAEGLLQEPVSGADLRLLEVVAKTGICNLPKLCRTGWFVAPRKIKTAPPYTRQTNTGTNPQKLLSQEAEGQLSPVWKYIIWNEKAELIDWSYFRSAEETNFQQTHPSRNRKEDAERKSVLELVGYWDKKLHDSISKGSGLSWQQAVELLTKDMPERAATTKS